MVKIDQDGGCLIGFDGLVVFEVIHLLLALRGLIKAENI